MMKRLIAVLCLVLFALGTLAGCGESQSGAYFFSGENGYFSLSNGVIALLDGQEVLDGGYISVEDGRQFEDVVSYTITLYVLSGNEEKVLLSNSVTDETENPVIIPGIVGRISGEEGTITSCKDDLRDNFYCKLVTESLDGQEDTYEMQLKMEEIVE